MTIFASLFLFLTFLIPLCHNAKVLFVAMGDSASHRRSMYLLAEALARNGHSVTFFAEIGRETDAFGRNITNHHVLLKVDPKDYEAAEDILNWILWTRSSQSPIDIVFPWNMGIKMTRRLMKEKLEEYKSILQQHWDLMIVDGLFTSTGIAFATEMKIPYIIYNPSLVTDVESMVRSIPYPVPTTPSMFMSSVAFDNKQFFTRVSLLTNSILDMVMFLVIDRFMFRPAVTEVVPDASLWNFYKYPQGSFVDFPSVLEYPRPATPDLFFIGGKCKSTTVLTDKTMLEFVEDPKSLGTIVLAFGHVVGWRGASNEVKVGFAKAFNKLKQYRIIWQYKEHPPIPLEPHVKVMSWLPQTELLNHPKTKLFISHGGLKSITEAVCGEVPAVVIPFFAEQVRNAHLFVRSGAAEALHKLNLTEENIYNSIVQVTQDNRYKTAVVKLKQYFTDKPIPPTESGIFWAEYIIRHKGLPEKWFKPAAINMSWITYFMLDVITVAILIVLVPTVVLYKTLRKHFKS